MKQDITEHEGKKYLKLIEPAIVGHEGGRIPIDVYCVLKAFGVTCPARQHAIKKLLTAGERGKGTAKQDLVGAMAAVNRAIDLCGEEPGFIPQTFEAVDIPFPVNDSHTVSKGIKGRGVSETPPTTALPKQEEPAKEGFQLPDLKPGHWKMSIYTQDGKDTGVVVWDSALDVGERARHSHKFYFEEFTLRDHCFARAIQFCNSKNEEAP